MTWLLVALICAVLTGVLAQAKGRSGGWWGLLGLLLGPLALVALLIAGTNEKGAVEKRIVSGELRRCPRCAEAVQAKAVVCRFCGFELPPAPNEKRATEDDEFGVGKAIGIAVGIVGFVVIVVVLSSGRGASSETALAGVDPHERARSSASEQSPTEPPASEAAASSEPEIPRSMRGDRGRYFLLSAVRTGDVVRSLHKRVGVDSIGYSLVETNCVTREYRDMGYSETGPEAIVERATRWSALMDGSSKSDLAYFVCAR